MTSPGDAGPTRSKSDLEEGTDFAPRFGADGLMPCVASDARTGAVLMLAWMNEEALELTLASGFAHYWSRSRRRIWKKGETSGALQQVVEVLTDCDQDALLLRVRVDRPDHTCHTGRPTCFYRAVDAGEASGLRRLTFVR